MKKILSAIISIIIISNFASLAFSNTKESKTIGNSYDIYYEIVEIKGGDTIWEIAEKYNIDNKISTKEYVNTILKFNNMKHDLIKSGDTIIIPIYLQ